jgi:arylsulfatase A-like enzyme
MQGSDLSAAALSGRSSGPDSAFFQIFGPYEGDGTEDGWRGVRTRRYMYARFRTQPWVLYDLQADPYQMTNLVGEKGAAAVQSEMEKRLTEWMRRTGDSWDYNWSHLVEDKGRLYRHRAFYTVDEYLKWAAQNPEADRL